MSIGVKIKQIRIEKKIKQTELAAKLGVSSSMIAQYENGHRTPKIETVRKIAEALDVTIGELIDDWSIYSRDDIVSDFENAKKQKYDSILQLLSDIYGNLEARCPNPLSEKPKHYYVFNNSVNSFILHEKDIEELYNSTSAFLPLLIDKIKDTRSEEEIIKEYISRELDVDMTNWKVILDTKDPDQE